MWERITVTRFRRPGSDQGSRLAGGGWITNKEIVLPGRTLDCWAVVYLTAGQGWYEDPLGGRKAVSAGDALVLFPDLAHGYGPETPGRWSEAWLAFHGPVFAALERDGVLDRRRPVLRPGLNADLIATFAALITAARAGSDDAQQVARLHLLLVRLGQATATASGFAAQAKARLAEQLDRQLDLAQVARGFALGEAAFRKRFARAVGVPPARWRQERRIEQAKHLLVESPSTLSAIAEQLGYCDQFFFARQFKRVTGQAPGAFRDGFHGRR